MSNFIGKWKDDKDVPVVGLKEFMDKQENLKEEDKKMWMEATNFLEYKKDGDTWIVVQTMDAMPDTVKEFRFKSGVAFEDTDLDGSPFKATTTIVNDSEITESGKNEVYGPFEVHRKVEGSIMKVTMKMGDMSMSSQMKKM